MIVVLLFLLNVGELKVGMISNAEEVWMKTDYNLILPKYLSVQNNPTKYAA